jgi:hypothetical protein
MNRGYSEMDVQCDFLKTTELPDTNINCIFTNPPYKYSVEFIEKSYELLKTSTSKNNKIIVMYLKLLFLEGLSRYQFFKKYPIKLVCIHPNRQGCDSNGTFDFKNGVSAVCYAWFVWDINYTGKTIVYWLLPN